MKTYCQPVFVAPFGNVTSISVVGFHVEVVFAHIPPSIRQYNEIIKESMRVLEPTLAEDELNRKMQIYTGKIKKVINASRIYSAEKSKRICAIRKENRLLDADEAYQKW